MLRLVEVGLFLVPFVAFGAWWLLANDGGPSPAMIGVTAGAVLLLAAALVWFGTHETIGVGKAYVPARLQNGEIVPGHAAAP